MPLPLITQRRLGPTHCDRCGDYINRFMALVERPHDTTGTASSFPIHPVFRQFKLAVTIYRATNRLAESLLIGYSPSS